MVEEQESSKHTKHNSPTDGPEEQSRRSGREHSNLEVEKYSLNMRCDCTIDFSLIVMIFQYYFCNLIFPNTNSSVGLMGPPNSFCFLVQNSLWVSASELQ